MYIERNICYKSVEAYPLPKELKDRLINGSARFDTAFAIDPCSMKGARIIYQALENTNSKLNLFGTRV